MKEHELIENVELRKNYLSRVEVLDKVKEVVLLPYGDSMTLTMVADYFEVGDKAINSLVFDNKEELISNGYTVLTGSQLNFFKESCQVKSRARQISLFTRRTILNIAMLLRDSVVAKEIRTQLLDVMEEKETIQKVEFNINTRQMLILGVIEATTDEERMLALSKLNKYDADKEAKITKERDVAVGKVVNLTKSDATFGIRESKNNLGVPERKFVKYLIDNKYIYRQKRLKPYSQFTMGETRYFTEIVELDIKGDEHKKMVLTVDGLEFFRTKISEINLHK